MIGVRQQYPSVYKTRRGMYLGYMGIFAYPPEKVYFSILQLAWA